MKQAIVSDLYDDVTGQPSPQLLDLEVTAQEEAQRKLAQSIESMAKTEGWQHIEKWMLAQLEGHKQRLVDEINFKEILRLQAAAKAISDLIGTIRNFSEVAKLEREKRNQEISSSFK